MKQVFSISLAVVLCAVLIFSCTSNIELPPSPNDLFPPSSSSGNLSSGGSSSSHGSSSSTGNPAPDPSGVTIVCPDWDLPNYPNKLAIGTNISAGCTANGSIINNDVALCGDITVEVEGNTSAPGNVTFKAVATCKSTKHILKTHIYEVVPDPSLSGTCAWNVANNKTNTDKATFPSGYRLLNSYGRCEGVTSADSLLAAAAYYYSVGTEQWPIDGLADAGTYNDVKPKITCTGFPSVTFVPCPSLSVIEITCDAILSDFCPGKNWDDVIWDAKQLTERLDRDFPASKNGGICAYFTKVIGWQTGNNAIVKINGIPTTNGSDQTIASTSISTVDGGYYIYADLPGTAYMYFNPNWMGSNILQTEPSIPPACAVGE